MQKTFLLWLIGAISFIYSYTAPSDTAVVAKVGTDKIVAAEFADRYLDFINSTGVNDNILTRRKILDNLISEVLLFNYDDNSKILNNPEYKKEIEWDKRQVLLAFLKDREVYAKIKIAPEELTKAYVRVNQKIAARHLFARTKDEAEYLLKLLQNGSTFEDLAKQVFTDSTLKNNGGYLGYFTWGDMDPDFEEAAFSLQPGQISKPVKTKYGYSIIEVEDRFQNPIITETEFEKNKNKLIRILKIAKKGPAEKEYIKSIFNPDNVRFNEKALSQLFNDISLSSSEIKTPKKSNHNIKNLVTYNKRNYSTEQIQNKLKELPNYQEGKLKDLNSFKAVIKGFLLQDKLLEIAKEKEYDKNIEEINTRDRLEKGTLMDYKVDEIAKSSIISDSTSRAYYKEHPDLFSSPDELKIQELVVPNKQQADELLSQIQKGADFGTLAKKYSVSELSNKNNGIIEFSPKEKFGKFKDKFWAAEVNTLIGPEKMDDKFGIFKILGKKEGTIKKYEDVKDEVEYAVKFNQKYLLVEQYVAKLKKKVPIQIFDQVLASIDLFKY